MKKLHEHLLVSNRIYAAWHGWPGSAAIHWGIFLFVAFFVGSTLVYNIQSDENLASVEVSVSQQGNRVSDLVHVRASQSEAQDHILVKFKNSMSAQAVAALEAHNTIKQIGEIKAIGVKLESISPDDTPEEVVQRLMVKEPKNIEYAEPDYIQTIQVTPNDSQYSSQWDLPKISAPTAWDITTGSSGVIIADLDTGAAPNHPDLASKLVPGYSFVNNSSDTSDGMWHGTFTACEEGAATNNTIGIAGLAWNNPVMPVQVCGSTGSCNISAVANGLAYAADHGAKVINMSLGGSSGTNAEQDAITYAWNKGVVLVASAGNNGTNAPTYPASYPHVMAVSATNSSDALAAFSSFGSWLAVAAPGQGILGCNLSGYQTSSGTSFSAPLVTGLAALLFSVNPTLTNAQVVSLIEGNTDDLGPAGFDDQYGWGRINVAKAVAAAGSVLQDKTAPTAPLNLVAEAPDSTKVNLSWSASTDNVGVAGYKVMQGSTLLATVSGTKYTDTSIVAGKSYVYTVTAYDAAGNVSGPSNTASIVIPAALPVLSITSYSVTKKTSTTATISWTTSMDSTGAVTYWAGSGPQASVSDSAAGTAHSVQLTGLTHQTRYSYQIRATSADSSMAAQSSVSSFRTPK